MVVWKEIKHEDDDARAGIDATSIATLWGDGVLKFFQVACETNRVHIEDVES